MNKLSPGFAILCFLISLPGTLFANESSSLQMPANYIELKQVFRERGQIIPFRAADATNPHAFANEIVKYHLGDFLTNQKMPGLKSIQKLDQAMNQGKAIGDKDFSLQTRFDLKRMQASITVSGPIETEVWTENKFRELCSRIKLFEGDRSLFSVEYRARPRDSRTYLNIEQTW